MVYFQQRQKGIASAGKQSLLGGRVVASQSASTRGSASETIEYIEIDALERGTVRWTCRSRGSADLPHRRDEKAILPRVFRTLDNKFRDARVEL
jgi:hypothetical protein